jgi:CubicO group peptidase (beta-lactamase class C family)
MKVAVLLLFAVLTAAAQDSADARIDAILKDWNKPDTPGAAVAVVKDGKLLFAKGYGVANLEYGIPIKPDTVFHVASVSKQFTAMALVLLERQDKLSLEDDIRKHLSELPDYGHKITIRNLLQHTSGIRDQWQTLALAGWRLDDVITQKQILRLMFRQKELNFPPGTEHLYSNGGYTLAAEIVARVSGKSFPEFCRETIFEPLGMKSTHFHDDHTHIDRNRAYSYNGGDGKWRAAPLNYANAGATSLFTTAPDLTLWLDNFRTGKLGNAGRLQEQAVLKDGRKIEYALGVSVSQYRGLRTIGHGGADAAYRSFVQYFPDEKLGVVVLSNLGSFNTGMIANRIAEVLLGDRMESEKKAAASPDRKFVEVDPSSLVRFEGVYLLGPGMLLEVTRNGTRLMASPVGQPPAELRPLASDRFWAERVSAELEFPQEGKLVLIQRGVRTNGERISGTKPQASELPAFAGSYWSEELETQYTLNVRNGKLHVDHAKHGDFTCTPAAGDYFTGGQWFMSQLRFTRDSSGKVDGFYAGGGRVRGIRFVRR